MGGNSGKLPTYDNDEDSSKIAHNPVETNNKQQ
jgi:hypothetical protein